MADIILHHYPTSPFSEKIRLVLGYKQLAWKSVIIPSIMPKPDVLALTGGYRKTPCLQIGADVYCDSALICEVLEQLQPTPALYPAVHPGLARVLAQWADSTLFWAAMGYSLQPRGAAAMFDGAPPEAAKAFAADRGAMTAGMTRLRPAESFGPEPTEGELLAATRTRYTLRRVGERAGLVHVHFPRIGFMLKPAPGA